MAFRDTLYVIISLFPGDVTAQGSGQGLTYVHITDSRGRTALLWTSIGLAVLTSLLQGMVTTVVAIAEDQGMWTFRFRIGRFEHWWWTTISVLLALSFGLIVVSFLSGSNSDSLGVLALSTATAIAIVRYAIPAWRNRRFIENRWLAWTGSSRTGIRYQYRSVCGDTHKWSQLSTSYKLKRAPPPSDDWGLALRSPKGLPQDPTDILDAIGPNPPASAAYSKHWEYGPCVFDDGYRAQGGTGNVSLLWGEPEGFRRRVSRAINSMPTGLLQSRPFTTDGYGGEGICLALGILGRNKGLVPRDLVYDFNDKWKEARGLHRINAVGSTSTTLENLSIWAPRPNKVMRSYYQNAMTQQFGTLPPSYIGAATELALILLDCRPRALRDWLELRMEQQDIGLNHKLSRPHVSIPMENSPTATNDELQTLYRTQYVSMILSLNFWVSGERHIIHPHGPKHTVRPDLICFALLHLAQGAVKLKDDRYVAGDGAFMPEWWEKPWVKARLLEEDASLTGDWHSCAAWLLGLQAWPIGLIERWPTWPEVVYQQT